MKKKQDFITTRGLTEYMKNDVKIMNANKNDKWWYPMVSGVFSGTAGGYSCYMFEGWKKSKQAKLDIPKIWQLKEVFRGANSFALTLGPVSMVQVVLYSWMKKNFLTEKSSSFQQNMVGIFSGSMGAFVSAPVEHIIVTQRKQKVGPLDAIKYLIKKNAFYAWTGLPPLWFREAGFGFTMLVGAENSEKYLKKTFNMNLEPLGSIGTGIIGATLTHPFDAIATKKQTSENPLSSIEAAKNIFKEEGSKGFTKGLGYRICLFTGCSIVIGKTNKYIQEKLSNNSSSFFSNKKIKNDDSLEIVEIKENDKTI